MPTFDFLDALVADLRPVRPAAPWSRVMLMWCLLSWAIVGGALLASGPLRDGVLGEMTHSPRFALEVVLGVAVGFVAIWAGLELGVPSGSRANRFWYPPLVLIGAWTLLVAYGVFNPTTPPSMNGKRVGCSIQIILASLPPLALAIYFLRNRILYFRSTAGCLVGAAAAAIPALWMHIACQTGSVHVLTHHFPPILLLAGVGALIARSVLRHT